MSATAAHVLIWNRDADLQPLARQGVRHTFHPGLNLVPAEAWDVLRLQTNPTMFVSFGADPFRMDALALVSAIEETKSRLTESMPASSDAVPGALALAWLSDQDLPPAVRRALTLSI